MTIKQFKLITGDEVICQVLEWGTDDIPELVIRNAMVVVSVDSPTSGTRYYTFKPWMVMQEGNECIITVNGGDIIAHANPTNDLLKYYYNSVENTKLSEEELDDKISDYINKVNDMINDTASDSDELNVIKFPSNSRLH